MYISEDSSISIPNFSKNWFVITDTAAPVSIITSTGISLISTIVRAQSTLLGGISVFGFSVFSPPAENTLFSLNFG